MIRTLRHIFLCLVLAVMGCAAGISQQARSQVTYHGSFLELRKGIARYNGTVVMLGGKVIETKGSQTGSEMTVLHLPLDRQGRPEDTDESQGRYLIRSVEFFDPAIYEKGTLLTLVGKLSGDEVRSIGSFEYVYPVVEAIEVKLWPKQEETSPRFHFGMGVGASF